MNSSELPPGGRLVEIWGDTVDIRHLSCSITIGISVSMAAYLGAKYLLLSITTPELVHAYSMLAGLGGCILSGVISAIFFAPKREIIEDPSDDPTWRDEIMGQLASQPGGLGSMADLSPAVIREMKELEIYDLFVSWSERSLEKNKND